VNKAHGRRPGSCCYQRRLEVTKARVQRAERRAPRHRPHGRPARWRNTEAVFARRLDKPTAPCVTSPAVRQRGHRKANFFGLDVSKVRTLGTGMTWDFIDRLRAIVKGKLLLKGIMTARTPRNRCATRGWLIVSNHGGARRRAAGDDRRAGRGRGRGGRSHPVPSTRRTPRHDVLKALGLGATASASAAVCVGLRRSAKLASIGARDHGQSSPRSSQVGALNISKITRISSLEHSRAGSAVVYRGGES